MSAPAATRQSEALDRLAETGALDELWWALTGVLLSAAQRLAPEATTPAEAAWIVAGRADPSLRQSADPANQTKGELSVSVPTKKAALRQENGPIDSPHVLTQGEVS